jgi:hypothetical protein
MARTKKVQGPDQAPEGVARLGESHLHRRHLYGGRLNAGLGSPWRKANARELREGKALHVSKMIAQVQSALTTFQKN